MNLAIRMIFHIAILIILILATTMEYFFEQDENSLSKFHKMYMKQYKR